jgi:hypothetical protein
MTEKQSIANKEIYQTLVSLIIHSEQIRWARLNALLIFDSIFIAVWAAIFTKSEAFPGKCYVLFILCIPGIILGFSWSRLGWRSSEYMDKFHSMAHMIENEFPEELQRPFGESEKIREYARKKPQIFSTSKTLVTYVPLMFSLIFLLLAVLSLIFA